jgi:hypothetical protein
MILKTRTKLRNSQLLNSVHNFGQPSHTLPPMACSMCQLGIHLLQLCSHWMSLGEAHLMEQV